MAYELNTIVAAGRLTADPDVRYTAGDHPTAIARYTLAVNRSNAVDYVPCVVFGKSAEFAEKYIKKGTALLVTGRIQTGSYTNKDGAKVYTTEVVVERQTSEKEGALNMNVVLLEGRLTRDPDVRYTAGDNPTCIARYTLAVTRGYFSKEKDASDFISCVCLGRSAELAEKHLRKGTAIAVRGLFQTGSYTKGGKKVYTTEVKVESMTFAKKKGDAKQDRTDRPAETVEKAVSSEKNNKEETEELDGFESLPEDEDDVLPFGSSVIPTT